MKRLWAKGALVCLVLDGLEPFVQLRCAVCLLVPTDAIQSE